MIDLKFTEMSLNLTVPWYLMASFAYYKEDDPIIGDTTFDSLAKYMLENLSKIKHIHKPYVTKKDLEAGTFLGKYPSRIPGAVKKLERLNMIDSPCIKVCRLSDCKAFCVGCWRSLD
jgi:hypothetical protein